MNTNTDLSLSASTSSLHITGSLDFASLVVVQPQLEAFITPLTNPFTVNFDSLAEFNSAAIPFMLDCLRIAAKQKKTCTFQSLPEKLTAMIKLTALDPLITAGEG